MNGRPNTIAELVVEYLADVAKRCSIPTVTHYRKRLSALVRSLGNSPLPEVTEAMIVEYLDRESKWQKGDRVGTLKAPDTIRSNVIAFNLFQTWLIDQKLLSGPIASKLKKPGGRERDALPTKEETKQILEHAPVDFRPIYLALRLTGARPGELCRAQISDLDRTAGEIILTAHKTAKKTGRPRRIAVGHESLVTLLEVAIGERTEGYIFVRTNNGPWTTDTLSAAYRTARKAAGLRSCLVLYLARHEHATAIYSLTGDLKAVMDALGHKKVSTSIRYTRADSKRMKANQQLFDDKLD